MATYNGIFLRSTLGQINTIPKPGALSSSPDLIPYGLSPVSNPQVFFRDNYNSDPGKALDAGAPNYIYLRGKNFSDKKIEDNTDGNRPRLFWSKASLLTYPANWNEITTTPTHNPVSMVADPGGIGVASEPFIWKPDNISNDHYCMIAKVPSPGYDNEIPNTLQISDFAGWVAKNGGIAWRNVIVNNATTVKLTGVQQFYEQGTEGGKIQFTIICTNVPKGTKVSFSAGAPGPNPPIYLEPTQVSTFPSFTTGVVCDVPAGYVSDIYFNLEAPPGVTDLSEAVIDIQTAYPTNPGTELFQYAHAPSEFGIPTVDEAYARIKRELERSGDSSRLLSHHDQYLEQLIALGGPKRLIVVGAMNYIWKH
ncbi:hypothetical protein [Taibaiella helva]|uniref:hypothetical protein n=1 Tax=Taibaiella helva TaxID=2301235 RepID=UPI000E579064|nr:hypothetical protein [Taibaiella helva]